jgi:hypothetical protein
MRLADFSGNFKLHIRVNCIIVQKLYIFRDKLAGREDRQKFDTVIKNVLMTDWNSNAFDSVDSIYFTTPGLDCLIFWHE